MDIKHTTTLGGKGTLPKEEAYYWNSTTDKLILKQSLVLVKIELDLPHCTKKLCKYFPTAN